jgi:16S rRNA (guanine966-N2)-methyltransferase
MRVVGGELRSRRLAGPPDGVRPTSDRVRESLFARLGDLAGAHVLDLFAGTGAVAIEALSRGAEYAVLVERSERAIEVIRRNLASLDLSERARVVRGDAARAVRQLAGSSRFDLVFLDPPYESDRLTAALEAVRDAGVLAPGATLVVETAKRHSLAPVPGLVVRDERSYGDTRLIWLVPAHDVNDPETE